jgi:hypothetical protein
MQYNFKDRKTGEKVRLSEVDEAVCRYWGDEIDEDKYHFMYDSLVVVGIVSANSQQCTTTEETLKAWLERSKAGWLESEICFFKEFLLERYIFMAWR